MSGTLLCCCLQSIDFICPFVPYSLLTCEQKSQKQTKSVWIFSQVTSNWCACIHFKRSQRSSLPGVITHIWRKWCASHINTGCVAMQKWTFSWKSIPGNMLSDYLYCSSKNYHFCRRLSYVADSLETFLKNFEEIFFSELCVNCLWSLMLVRPNDQGQCQTGTRPKPSHNAIWCLPFFE